MDKLKYTRTNRFFSKIFEKVLIIWKKTAFLMPIYYEGVRKN